MIPFIDLPPLQIGPISIQAFGTMVAIAVIVGVLISRRRAHRLDLDQAIAEKMFSWLLVGGFIGAHLFAVLLYFPSSIRSDPWILLRFWQHLSSFGGMIGGLIALWLFLWRKNVLLTRIKRRAYFSHVAYVFPFSLAIGRIGCAIIHDHPGSITDFPLAVSLSSDAAQNLLSSVYPSSTMAEFASNFSELGFHDLGLYEMLYLMLFLIPVFLWLDRRQGSEYHFATAFVLLYMPVRFGLDFLRISDATYAGLTPAQWMAAGSLLALLIYWIQKKCLSPAC